MQPSEPISSLSGYPDYPDRPLQKKTEERLSKWTMLAYAPPSLTTVPMAFLISVYVIQFYEQVGAPLGLLAFFQALARAFDVITDPTMSYLTDSCRHKQGRRRPFMFSGAPFYAFCLIMLLFPQPQLSPVGVSCWFGFFYIGFFLFSTYCNIPYDALAPELTSNPEVRLAALWRRRSASRAGACCAPRTLGAAPNLAAASGRATRVRAGACNAPRHLAQHPSRCCFWPRDASRPRRRLQRTTHTWRSFAAPFYLVLGPALRGRRAG